MAHGPRIQRVGQDIDRAFRAAVAAHEDVDGGVAEFRPGVEADVRLPQQQDAGDALVRAEVVKVRGKDVGAARARRLAQGFFQPQRIGQQRRRHIVEFHQQVQAKVLGMKSTGYKNPEGLTEPGHTTTARDLSILATRLMRDFPDYVPYYAIKKYHYEGTPTANDSNRNTLLFRDPSVDGLKTGHTDAAGYCLIATAKRDFPNLGTPGAAPGTPASVGSRRLLSIVLGTASENARANESQKLLNWGYTAFEAVKLFDALQPVVTPAVWKGKDAVVKIGNVQSIVVAVPAGSAAKIKTQVARADPLVAPFTKGQQLAMLKVSVGEQPLIDVPLVALDAVEQAGILGRTWDAIRLWIK